MPVSEGTSCQLSLAIPVLNELRPVVMLSEMLIANMEVGANSQWWKWGRAVRTRTVVTTIWFQWCTSGKILFWLQRRISCATLPAQLLCVRLVGRQVHVHFLLMYPDVPINTHWLCGEKCALLRIVHSSHCGNKMATRQHETGNGGLRTTRFVCGVFN